MDCPACATPAADEARFCASCGHSLADAPASAESRRVVSVLFCDLVGFTALSERLDPEALRGMQMRYYRLMRDAVDEFGGVVEKYIGDAVMGVFGIPTLAEDDALRAVRAAFAMRDAVIQLENELSPGLDIRLGVRIGINTGEVLAATRRADQMLVSGDAVNIAARLQQAAPPGGILISQATHALVRGVVAGEPVPPLQLKGKREPVAAMLVTEAPVAETHPAAVPRSKEGPLIGREGELAYLRAIYEHVAHGRSGGHLLTLLGEPGVGKSRLGTEFLCAPLATPGVLTGVGRCRPHRNGEALGPLAEALVTLAGPERDAIPFDHLDQEEISRVVRKTLAAAAGGRPMILIFDDVQWAQPALLDLIEHLADSARDFPLIIICFARLELLDSRPGWGGGKLSSSSILLNPLNAEATAELIRFHGEVMPHGTDAEETVVGIVERSGGNPLFVEQLVAAVRGGHEIGTLPLTVQTVIAARVDALGPDERTTLQYAAVIGREFDAEVLHELCAPAQVATLERTLAQLTRKQFVEPRGTAYQFRNAQIQEVARDALPKRVRAGIHLRIADLLAARGGFATERDACAHLEQAVRHFEELGMAERAAAQRPRLAAALSRITEQALRGGRLQDAVDPLQRTLAALTPDDPERWRVQLTLGTALVAAGSFDEAGQALRSVAQEADRRGDRVLRTHATLELGRLPGVSENPEEVLAQAREAMAVFDAAGDQAGQAKAWLRMGHAHQAARRYGQAAPAFEHSLTDAEQSGDPLDLATIMGGLAMSLWLGPVPAPQAIDRCADLLRHIPEGKELARMAVSCPLAMLLAMRGDLGEATALLDEAEQLAAELAHKHVMISVAVFAAEVRGLAGDEQGALRRLSVAHHALSKIGAPMLDTIIANQVRIHLDAGRIDRAAELIGGLGEGEARGADTADHPASWHGARARFALAVGRLDVAERSVAAAVEAAFRSDSLASQALALLDHAHYLQRAGDPEAARGAAGRAGALCRRKGDLAGAAKVRAFLADLSETDLSETGLSETGES